jgi:hypothetical protein
MIFQKKKLALETQKLFLIFARQLFHKIEQAKYLNKVGK